MAETMAAELLTALGMTVPVLQAPMAGVSSPAMAAAVSEAGGLGAIAAGAGTAQAAGTMIAALRQRTARPFNLNVFAHRPAIANIAVETAWIETIRPRFAALGATPPSRLREIYQSFVTDDDMLAMLLATRPAVVSLHFGLPDAARLRALREAGIMLLATVTSLAEAQQAERAGVNAVVAQGYEAGGHRGVFEPDAGDSRLGTMALTRLLATRIGLPVIAAGGIMDGAGIAAALALGAAAAQLGTAFVGTDESLADEAYRAALFSDAAHHTVMTRAISGRPARCLANKFTALGAETGKRGIPAYPIAYDLGKALNAAGKNSGEAGYGAHWAGQGAPLARRLPAGALVRALAGEMRRL